MTDTPKLEPISDEEVLRVKNGLGDLYCKVMDADETILNPRDNIIGDALHLITELSRRPTPSPSADAPKLGPMMCPLPTPIDLFRVALEGANTAMPVLITMLKTAELKGGLMVADEIMGNVKCALKVLNENSAALVPSADAGDGLPDVDVREWIERQRYDAMMDNAGSLNHRRWEAIASCVAALASRLQVDARDAERFRHLRDRAGNNIMDRLKDECQPAKWDELVDGDIERFAALASGAKP